MSELVPTTPGAAWIAAATLAAAALVAALEWRRAATARAAVRAVRVAAAILAPLALGVLLLAPARRLTPHGARTVVLAGAGAEAGAARRTADSLRAALVRRDTIPDLAWLLRTRVSPETLHVVGWGLDAADRAAARAASLAVRLHPAAPPAGLARLAWDRAAAVGTPVRIEGALAGAAPGTVVRLDDPGGAADSTRTDTAGTFVLRARPRAAGRHRLVVHAALEGRTVAETLGVAVTPPTLPRVLVVEAAPGFETRHLKTWLAAAGAEVAVRSHVSRDLFRYEYLNRERLALERLGPATFAEFDVIVADASALAGLPPAERAALRSAVADSGRGLLVRADDAALDAARRRALARDGLLPFVPVRLADARTRAVRPAWPGRTATGSVAVPALAWSLVPRFGVATLAADADDRAVAQLAPLGAGRVALTLVTEPGRWLLAGDRVAYAEYWTHLLDAAASGVVGRARWAIAGAGPLLVHEPVRLRLTTPTTAATALVTDPRGGRDTVHLVADPYEPAVRHGLYWPRHAGWHRVEGGEAALDFLVSGDDGWRSWQAAERSAATLRLAAAAPPPAARAGAGPAAAVEELRPLPRGWAYLVFLGSVTVLWAAGRRMGSRDSTNRPGRSYLGSEPPPDRRDGAGT